MIAIDFWGQIGGAFSHENAIVSQPRKAARQKARQRHRRNLREQKPRQRNELPPIHPRLLRRREAGQETLLELEGLTTSNRTKLNELHR